MLRRIGFVSIGLLLCLISGRAYWLQNNLVGWKGLKKFKVDQSRNDEVAILVTGCTGVLGTNLIQRLKALNSQVYGTFRSYKKLYEVFSADHDQFIQVDLLKMEAVRYLPHHLPQASRRILINNAGVYLEGSTRETLRESLQVNFFAPVSLIERSLQLPHPSTDIINISSGDGEKQFIHSDIAAALEVCRTVEDLKSYAGRLIERFDDSFEYAYGLSPMYSLSKAFLNKATQLLHWSLQTTGESSLTRIVALCPGNFISAMTSEEELTATDQAAFMLPVEEAVERMLPVIFNSNQKYPGGYFYRYGERIDW